MSQTIVIVASDVTPVWKLWKQTDDNNFDNHIGDYFDEMKGEHQENFKAKPLNFWHCMMWHITQILRQFHMKSPQQYY